MNLDTTNIRNNALLGFNSIQSNNNKGEKMDKAQNNNQINVGHYTIEPKYVRLLLVFHTMLNKSNDDILFKDNLILNFEELIATKKMSYNNIFLVMNFLEMSIEIYTNKKAKNNYEIFLDMKDLYSYFSKYFMVSRNELIFYCLDIKSKHIFAFDLTGEVE